MSYGMVSTITEHIWRPERGQSACGSQGAVAREDYLSVCQVLRKKGKWLVLAIMIWCSRKSVCLKATNLSLLMEA